MDWMVLPIYGAIALVSVVIAYFLSRRIGDVRRPPSHRLLLSLLAGSVWPLLLVGLVEFGSFAAYAKVQERREDVGVVT